MVPHNTAAPLQVVPVLQEQVAAWRAMLPVAAALRNPQLQERHWQKVATLLGDGLQPTEPGFTVQTLFDRQVCPQVLPGEFLAPNACLSIGKGGLRDVGCVHDCLNLSDCTPHVSAAAAHSLLFALQLVTLKEELVAVSTEASQEASLEGMLHRVQAKWDGIEFVVKPFRDLKDTWLLAGVEDVQAVLEDSLVMMGTIAASRFVAGELDLPVWAFMLQSQSLDTATNHPYAYER